MALTNVGVLTEGFDDPGVSCIAMARPTKSESLYAQCVGRGARLAPGKKDCIVLDFVDLSDLSLMNLPSLLGIPREINLQGADAAEAVDLYHQLRFDFPGFEIEASEITLSEIKHRAESFDPLTMELHPDITAITGNGWFSLGKKGLALFFFRANGNICKAEILAKGKRKAERYHVFLDGVCKAKFSKIIAAVEAVDYEIEKMGRVPIITARDDADWRIEDPSPDIIQSLAQLQPPRRARTLSDALGYLCFAQHHPPKRQPNPKRQRK